MSTMSGGPNIVTNGLVLHLDAANVKSFRGVQTTNYLTNPEVEVTKGEFGQYYNLVTIFETYGLVPYSLSFEMKANKAGSVLWYMQNGSWTKYNFVASSVNVTTEWQRFKFENITPSGPTAGWTANTPTDNRAMLASYTTYGSGVNPTVRNMQLELGSVATPFVIGTRGTTVATGGGWADRTSNAYHGTLTNGPTFNAANGGSIVFDGVDDYITTNSIQQYLEYTFMFFIKWITLTSFNSRCFGLDGYGTYTIFNPNNIGYHYNPLGGSPPSVVLSSNVDIGLNNWCCICVTESRANTKASIYINGTLRNETSVVSSSGFVNKIYLGAQNTTAGLVANCQIANFSLYNRVLSAQEVLQNYNAQKSRFGLS